METNLQYLVTPEDKKTLHDLSHLAVRIDRKWVKLNKLIPEDIKNSYFSFFRDLGTFIDLLKKLGANNAEIPNKTG